MPSVLLKIKPPRNSLVEFSIDHPGDSFRIFASHPMKDGLRVIVEAEIPDPTALCQVFDAAPEVRSYEVLHNDLGTVLVQYETAEPTPRAAARTAGILPQYPVLLRNGWLTVETITSWDRLSQLKTEFEDSDVSFEVLSVSQSVEMTDLLTDRQWDVLTEAIERGYYDSPRGCSLTDLANTLDVNPSAVSGVLHRAEERIIKAFAAEAKQDDGFSSSE